MPAPVRVLAMKLRSARLFAAATASTSSDMYRLWTAGNNDVDYGDLYYHDGLVSEAYARVRRLEQELAQATVRRQLAKEARVPFLTSMADLARIRYW